MSLGAGVAFVNLHNAKSGYILAVSIFGVVAGQKHVDKVDDPNALVNVLA